MIQWEQWMEIRDLRSQGHSIRSIARLTGHSRNTVRKVLGQKKPQAFRSPEKSSKLDDFKEYAGNRYQDCALSAVRILDEIRRQGYTGSIQTLRRYLQSLRPSRHALQKMTVRFETPPGQQGQVDWGFAGRFADAAGRLINIYIFAMVLGFSRMMYVKFTTSMKLPELISCHMEAFSFFNGWPASILYDNMKQVRRGATGWNPLFADFVSHYGIVPKTHRIYRPRTKGKVERMMDYIKGNFLNGRTFIDLEDLNVQSRKWLDQTANVRIHATTGCPPAELFTKENLIAYGSVVPYRISERTLRRVDSEGFVHYDRSRYSVPPEHVGKTVIVQQDDRIITVRCQDLILVEHDLALRPGSCVVKPEHIRQLCELSLQRKEVPTAHWTVTFQQEVQAPSLQTYEEVCR